MKKELNCMDKKKIENRAEKVLSAYKYDSNTDVYVDAVCLARFFGFDVEEKKTLSATEDGCITVSENQNEKCIAVNDTRSFEAKRFIIVHELAHYLLHYTGSGKFFMHRENTKGKNLEENDADYLAACLLMPKNSFKEQYDLLKKDKKSQEEIVVILQSKFRTPSESIERRISEVCRWVS